MWVEDRELQGGAGLRVHVLDELLLRVGGAAEGRREGHPVPLVSAKTRALPGGLFGYLRLDGKEGRLSSYLSSYSSSLSELSHVLSTSN